MIDFSRNYFELFGLPQCYRFDPARLEQAYRKLQIEVPRNNASRCSRRRG